MFNLISIKYNQFSAHVIILAKIMQAINLIRESRKCQTLHRGSDKIYELHIELHKFSCSKSSVCKCPSRTHVHLPEGKSFRDCLAFDFRASA